MRTFDPINIITVTLFYMIMSLYTFAIFLIFAYVSDFFALVNNGSVPLAVKIILGGSLFGLMILGVILGKEFYEDFF